MAVIPSNRPTPLHDPVTSSELSQRCGGGGASTPAHATTTTQAVAARKVDGVAASRWPQLRSLLQQILRHDTAGSHRQNAPLLLLHPDFWLEAVDTQHRYGLHLRAFHDAWKRDMASLSPQQGDDRDRSFFYWLDHGRGAQLELTECSRAALEHKRVAYYRSDTERRDFEVAVVHNTPESVPVRLEYVATHRAVHTDSGSKWIFVLTRDARLYVARKRKGHFHHSSFLAGAPIAAAGKIYVRDGRIRAIEPHSGHFKPTLENLSFLREVLACHGYDLQSIRFIKPKKWTGLWPYASRSDDDDWGDDALASDSDDP
ncbi:hypothetical protein PINS_up005339 [Pythium insidiosum]|nr:hypothetical protein PINS_up005339 [Pythium insidiosum]